MTCTCGRICVGMQVTEQRNWNPDCSEHGLGTPWYLAPERVARRKAMSDRAVSLQMQASDARRLARAPKL